MKNILIYKSEDNLCITHFVDSLDVEAVQLQADKLLPHGTRYRVGTTDELPADRTFRDAWDIDAADLDHVSGLNVITRAIESLTTQIEQRRTDMDNVETQQHKQHIQQAIDTLQQALDDKQQHLEQFKQQHNITQS